MLLWSQCGTLKCCAPKIYAVVHVILDCRLTHGLLVFVYVWLSFHFFGFCEVDTCGGDMTGNDGMLSISAVVEPQIPCSEDMTGDDGMLSISAVIVTQNTCKIVV